MSRLKFGIMVWYGDRPLQNKIENLYDLGFDYISLALDYPWPEELREDEIRLLANLKEEYDLDLAFHGPWAGFFVSHPREEISNACLKILSSCLKFASKFNPLYFSFHQNAEAAGVAFEEIRKRIFNRVLETTERVAQLGKKFGTPIAIENVSNPLFGTPSQFKFLLRFEDLSLCLDIGHAIRSQWIIKERRIKELLDEKMELKDWVRIFKTKILVIHVHDVLLEDEKGPPQDHLILGKGSLNFQEILRLIRETNCRYILLETYLKRKGIPASYRDLKENLEMCKSFLH